MPAPLSTTLRNRLASITVEAREVATSICRAALENLAVHEADYRPHMTVEQRQLRNRLRARGRALGDERDARTGCQAITHLADDASYEHWHRLLFTLFLAENDLLFTDEANGSVPIPLGDCEELASGLGARDGFDLACRFASTTLPGVFRRDDPILELSFPANDRRKLRDLLDAIPPEVFTASDSLGWTYQFWQTQRKQEVNDSGKKIGADEISPVTQLFTEDYMVDFLLDNTLGAWWAGKQLALNPQLSTLNSEEELRQAVALPGCPWKYLRFIRPDAAKASPSPPLEGGEGRGEVGAPGKWTPAAGTFDGWPKSAAALRALDPCMGSGHFVVAMFERLVALRLAEEKLDEAAAVAAVIRDNLFGLEIDPRCTQIGAFNLALAAWRRVGHRPLPAMNLACSGLAPNTREADWLAIAGDNQKLQRGMERLYRLFQKAAVLGSLINPRAGEGDLLVAAFHELQPLLEKALAQETKDDKPHDQSAEALAKVEMAVTARGLAKAAEILAGQFTLVATNVPYLGRDTQDDVLKDFCERVYPAAKSDLATCFVERCIDFCRSGGSVGLVVPQNWLFLGRYKELRKRLLSEVCWTSVSRLGPRAFDTISGEVVKAALLQLTRARPEPSQHFFGFDASEGPTGSDKAETLRETALMVARQGDQVRNPDARIAFGIEAGVPRLDVVAASYHGQGSRDSSRFMFCWWELSRIRDGWIPLQTTVTQTIPFGGAHYCLLWEDGNGRLAANIRAYAAEGSVSPDWNAGLQCWGKPGVLISQTGALAATVYLQHAFDSNSAVIQPAAAENLVAIWAYCSSDEYHQEVRQIDQKLNVTNATLVKIPFDLAHWQKVAAEKYPHGLPKPFSSDPTQWLFTGCPQGADQPLHVAVARLLGYQWPRQTGSSFPDCPALGPDGLEKFADDDGIVCLSALNREQPAAQRLRAFLTAALGQYNERDLIRKSGGKGSTKASLEEWLRDDFFAQHCALFHSRPFLWHLWDGLKDGFHALVNYHQLDHGNLKKLAYTYLGDWIRDQKAAAEADTSGAAERLGAAKKLQAKLIAILEGEAPLDLFVRWKPLSQQPIGWNPDLNDGVRLNIRPFLLAGDVGAKGAGLFRAKPGIDPDSKPDRGTEPKRPKADYPWFWCAEGPGTDPAGGKEFTGRRWNTAHFTLQARQNAGKHK